MERFLRYSLEHERPIRLILTLPEGAMKQVSAVVEGLTEDSVSLYVLRPLRRLTVRREDILSADYTPKDEGQD